MWYWVLKWSLVLSYFVGDATFEIAGEGSGLHPLELSELDWLPSQVVIQLHCEDGRRGALILAALFPCMKN